MVRSKGGRSSISLIYFYLPKAAITVQCREKLCVALGLNEIILPWYCIWLLYCKSIVFAINDAKSESSVYFGANAKAEAHSVWASSVTFIERMLSVLFFLFFCFRTSQVSHGMYRLCYLRIQSKSVGGGCYVTGMSMRHSFELFKYANEVIAVSGMYNPYIYEVTTVIWCLNLGAFGSGHILIVILDNTELCSQCLVLWWSRGQLI